MFLHLLSAGEFIKLPHFFLCLPSKMIVSSFSNTSLLAVLLQVFHSEKNHTFLATGTFQINVSLAADQLRNCGCIILVLHFSFWLWSLMFIKIITISRQGTIYEFLCRRAGTACYITAVYCNINSKKVLWWLKGVCINALFKLGFKWWLRLTKFRLPIHVSNNLRAIFIQDTFLQVAFSLLHSARIPDKYINIAVESLSHINDSSQGKILCGSQDYKQSKHHPSEQINKQGIHRKVICNDCL